MKKEVKVLFNWKFLLILISLLILILFYLPTNKTPLVNKCTSNQDCVKIQTTCCACNMGGKEKCVLNSEKETYLENLKNCSKKILCPAVFQCEIESCECLNGECIEL